MSMWNKVLLGLIGVASLLLFYMAVRTLKTHQSWRELARKYEQAIDRVQRENKSLAGGVEKSGAPMQPGIRQLRLELNTFLMDRGRAWFNCDAKVKVNPEEGSAEVAVTTDQPAPNGITDNTVVYAFEEADVQKNKGRYLGEFKVTKVDGKQSLLAPTSRLTPREAERLAAAQRPWTLYELMPRDNQTQPPRDYKVLLDAERMRQTRLANRIAESTVDNKLVADAVAQGKQQEEAVNRDVAAAKEDAKKFGAEREAVAKYRQSLQQELDATNADIVRLIKENQEKAQRMAKLQWEATRRIDQRTRAMAQSGAGGT